MDDDIVVISVDDFKRDEQNMLPKPRSFYYKPVVEYTKEGVFVANYESIREASRATGVSEGAIGNVCSGRHLHTSKSLGERIFLFRGDDIGKRLQKIEEGYNEYWSNNPHVGKCKEVCEYTLGGKLLFKYPALKQAAIVNNVSSIQIANCCKGKRLFVGKHIYLYPEDTSIKERVKLVKKELYRLSKKRPKYREVDQYSLDGTFIKAFPSASATSKELGIHVSEITRCCNNRDFKGHYKLTTGGFIFLWVGDSISERLELIKQKQNKKK